MAMSDVAINEVMELITARGGKLADGVAALEADVSGSWLPVADRPRGP